MFAQLIPVNGGVPITIEKDVCVVGRLREHCDIVLEKKSISKMHCVLIKTDGLLFVRDLASTNGVKVNGQRITRGALLPGDQLAFASEKFKVHLGADPAPPRVGERTEMLDHIDLPPLEPFTPSPEIPRLRDSSIDEDSPRASRNGV